MRLVAVVRSQVPRILRSRRTAGLLILITLVALMVLSQLERLSPAENVVSALVAPFQYSLTRLSDGVGELWATVRDIGTLRTRVKELQEQVDLLMIENVRLQEAAIENATLREQLNFKQAHPTFTLLSAEVIGRDPSNLLRYLIIDRGSRDGVAPGMPVITAAGLVGRVTHTTANSAQVMLLTDPASSVSALIQSSRATGVVDGQASPILVMRYIQQGDTVNVGDIVLTSGFGGKFPKRLVIGQVIAVHQRDNELFQEAEIRSAVDFSRLEMVMVILNFLPTE